MKRCAWRKGRIGSSKCWRDTEHEIDAEAKRQIRAALFKRFKMLEAVNNGES